MAQADRELVAVEPCLLRQKAGSFDGQLNANIQLSIDCILRAQMNLRDTVILGRPGQTEVSARRIHSQQFLYLTTESLCGGWIRTVRKL